METLSAGTDAPLRAALDALATRMGLGLLLIDSDGHPRFCNRAAMDLLGCRNASAVPAQWEALQSARRPAWEGQPSSAGAAASEPFIAELPVNGSTRFLRGEFRAARDGHEIFLKDRRQLGELDIELLCASRMREWIHQCEALVHDANGSLNTIQLTLELLDGQWPGPRAGEQASEPHRRSHISVIRDNLDKLKNTLRQFTGAHDPAPPVADFDLRDVVREAASTLRMPARRRRIELQADVGAAPMRIEGNRARIRQALVNVALSRVEELPERSVLTLEARSGAGGVELTCRDGGELGGHVRSGIHRIFLAESGAGSGSDALRLARAIVECESGEFLVDSGAGIGTTFRFVFEPLRA